jgi:hypothetical protein
MLVEIQQNLFVAESQIKSVRVKEVMTPAVEGHGTTPPVPPTGTGTYKVYVEVDGFSYELNHAAFASVALAEAYIKGKFASSIDLTT